MAQWNARSTCLACIYSSRRSFKFLLCMSVLSICLLVVRYRGNISRKFILMSMGGATEKKRVRKINSVKMQQTPLKAPPHLDIHLQTKNEVPSLSFASYYTSNMVLQKSPAKNTIWGHASPDGDMIKVHLSGCTPLTSITRKGIWKVQLPPHNIGGPFTLTAKSSRSRRAVTLSNIMFGDVWFCSGQSNMQMTVKQIWNATEELADADNFPDIRVFTVASEIASTPQIDLTSLLGGWDVASQQVLGDGNWGSFSAVCWFYGKELYRRLQYPIGLIASTWGGTPIEAWSSLDSLRKCLPKSKIDNIKPETSHSPTAIWNRMVHPLFNLTIYGVIWYQGEANSAAPSMDIYNCTFPAMIDDWRSKFYEGTNGQTNRMLPFGFVQLSADRDLDTIMGFSDIRWHQTADIGFAPNSKLRNVFMAVAMDLPDFKATFDSIHPGDKQDIGKRLALSGLTVAYNIDVGKWQGPFPTEYTLTTVSQTITILFDNGVSKIKLNSKNGFEVCCADTKTYVCRENVIDNWHKAPVVWNNGYSVTISYKNKCSNKHILGIRYAWRQSPCHFKECAVYSVENSLPGPPFVKIGPF